MYTVDPTFSAYSLIRRTEQQSILLNHRRTMSLSSTEIENATLRDGAATRIFAGFQRLGKFLPQVKRYEQIAARAESVTVFGVADVTPPLIPNLTYIPLSPSDQLAREWFVISHGDGYSSGLATEEVSEIDDRDDQRQLKGIWTFDAEKIVSIMHDWLTSPVDARPHPERSDSERQRE
jgi:DICT domain-containing protein